jgi:hypothetical protein
VHFALLAMTVSATRKLTQIGLLLAVLGAAAIAVGAAGRMLASSRGTGRSPGPVASWGWIVGGALAIALGLGLSLIAFHYGINPYKPRPVKQ